MYTVNTSHGIHFQKAVDTGNKRRGDDANVVAASSSKRSGDVAGR